MSRSTITHLIGYDVADPRRLARVRRYLVSRSYPVQYSVFVARLTRCQLGEIIVGLGRIIDAQRDHVRLYPLPHAAELTQLGASALPEGVLLASASPAQDGLVRRREADVR